MPHRMEEANSTQAYNQQKNKKKLKQIIKKKEAKKAINSSKILKCF